MSSLPLLADISAGSSNLIRGNEATTRLGVVPVGGRDGRCSLTWALRIQRKAHLSDVRCREVVRSLKVAKDAI